MKSKGISIEELRNIQKKKKPLKYRNSPTLYNGIRFQSKAECERYKELELMKKVGDISYFLRQVPFDLPGGIKYYCDFMVIKYGMRSIGLTFSRQCVQAYFVTYEDVKSNATANNRVFINKIKQVKAIYDVDIEIIIK